MGTYPSLVLGSSHFVFVAIAAASLGLPAQNPPFNLLDYRVIRLAGHALAKTHLKHPEEADHSIEGIVVVGAQEETLAENVGRDGFSIKLDSFGKFSIRRRLGTLRKIPLTGETRMTSTKRKVKFVAIGHCDSLKELTLNVEPVAQLPVGSKP